MSLPTKSLPQIDNSAHSLLDNFINLIPSQNPEYDCVVMAISIAKKVISYLTTCFLSWNIHNYGNWLTSDFPRFFRGLYNKYYKRAYI